MSIRNYANKEKYYDDNHKKIIFFTCRTRTEHFNLLEKISKNSRAYFHFFNGYNETWRNGTKWGRQNQIKSNQN